MTFLCYEENAFECYTKIIIKSKSFKISDSFAAVAVLLKLLLLLATCLTLLRLEKKFKELKKKKVQENKLDIFMMFGENIYTCP